MFNRSRNAGAQTKTIMEKNVNEILMLRYQIKRGIEQQVAEAACPASLGFVKRIKYELITTPQDVAEGGNQGGSFRLFRL